MDPIEKALSDFARAIIGVVKNDGFVSEDENDVDWLDPEEELEKAVKRARDAIVAVKA